MATIAMIFKAGEPCGNGMKILHDLIARVQVLHEWVILLLAGEKKKRGFTAKHAWHSDCSGTVG